MSVATAAAVPREPESDVGAHAHNPDGVEEREKGGKERIGELSEGRTEERIEGRAGWRAELELGFVAREQRKGFEIEM